MHSNPSVGFNMAEQRRLRSHRYSIQRQEEIDCLLLSGRFACVCCAVLCLCLSGEGERERGV